MTYVPDNYDPLTEEGRSNISDLLASVMDELADAGASMLLAEVRTMRFQLVHMGDA